MVRDPEPEFTRRDPWCEGAEFCWLAHTDEGTQSVDADSITATENPAIGDDIRLINSAGRSWKCIAWPWKCK